MSEKDIQAIISRVQSGETEQFGQIFDLFSDKIFRHISFRVKDREAAKDLTSEVFLGAWQSLPRYHPQADAKFSTWLFSIARRILADYYRKNRSDQGRVSLDDIAAFLPDSGASPEELVNLQISSEEIIKAVRLLPVDMAEAVTLRYIDEMEYEEMASITRKQPGNLRVLVHRGLSQIRRIFGHE